MIKKGLIFYLAFHCEQCRVLLSSTEGLQVWGFPEHGFVFIMQKYLAVYFKAVLRIRIHRIHMFLGLPDPDPLVIGMDPDPDPSSSCKNSKKNLDSYRFSYFVTLFDFLSLKNDVK